MNKQNLKSPTQAVLANVQLEGGAGPPSLLGEEPEAEELLQAYETQKKVSVKHFYTLTLEELHRLLVSTS